MSFDLNQQYLIGTIDRDPKRASTPTGKQKIDFTVSVKSQGKGKEYTTYVPCESWHESHIETIAKGMRVAVFGKFKTDSWEKDGKKNYFSKISVNDLFICPKLLRLVMSPKAGTVHPEPELPQKKFSQLDPPTQSSFTDEDIPF